MKRRDFLKASAAAGVVTVCGTQLAAAQGQTGGGNRMPKLTLPEKPAELNLCLQCWSLTIVRIAGHRRRARDRRSPRKHLVHRREVIQPLQAAP